MRNIRAAQYHTLWIRQDMTLYRKTPIAVSYTDVIPKDYFIDDGGNVWKSISLLNFYDDNDATEVEREFEAFLRRIGAHLRIREDSSGYSYYKTSTRFDALTAATISAKFTGSSLTITNDMIPSFLSGNGSFPDVGDLEPC